MRASDAVNGSMGSASMDTATVARGESAWSWCIGELLCKVRSAIPGRVQLEIDTHSETTLNVETDTGGGEAICKMVTAMPSSAEEVRGSVEFGDRSSLREQSEV